jgi:hypothetical protein
MKGGAVATGFVDARVQSKTELPHRDCARRLRTTRSCTSWQVNQFFAASLKNDAASIRAVFSQRVSIQFHPKTRCPRNLENAVNELGLLHEELAAKGRFGEIGGEEFDKWRAGTCGAEVRARGDADPALPTMGNNELPAVGRDLHNLPGFRETANSSDIRLKDINLPGVC